MLLSVYGGHLTGEGAGDRGGEGGGGGQRAADLPSLLSAHAISRLSQQVRWWRQTDYVSVLLIWHSGMQLEEAINKQ